MKKLFAARRRTLILGAVLLPLLLLFVWVSARTGPLAPVAVTVQTVQQRALAPALFGIGTVEARYTHKIGPTYAGRLSRVDVQPGDAVRAGQVLGEMDAVDLDDRIAAQGAAIRRAEAAVAAAEAQLQDATARHGFAQNQRRRYEQLWQAHAVSEEAIAAKSQELQVAQGGMNAARANLLATQQDAARLRSERDGLQRQRTNLRLVAPADGIVARRDADAGTTVVAGQTVLELIDQSDIWINTRFDQRHSGALKAGLPAQIRLRSLGQNLAGDLTRVELVADSVTEERLAKVVFKRLPQNLPALGELAEVSVALPPLPAAPVVPGASLHRVNGEIGVWRLREQALQFVAVTPGAADLDGNVQILRGLAAGDQIVVYSEHALTAHSRTAVVQRITGQAS